MLQCQIKQEGFIRNKIIRVNKSTGNRMLSQANLFLASALTQPIITCSKLTIEALEQDVKYVQS